MEARSEVLDFLKSKLDEVFQHPENYVAWKQGIDLNHIYAYYGIPVNFVERRTPECESYVREILGLLDFAARKEGLTIALGYANQTDNDFVHFKKSEPMVSLPLRSYEELEAKWKKQWFAGKVKALLGK